MKCPYQTKVIHKPEYIDECVKNFAEDITEFGECIKVNVRFIIHRGRIKHIKQ